MQPSRFTVAGWASRAPGRGTIHDAIDGAHTQRGHEETRPYNTTPDNGPPLIM